MGLQLGFIYRTFSPHCSPESILHLYKTQVMPILEYGNKGDCTNIYTLYTP